MDPISAAVVAGVVVATVAGVVGYRRTNKAWAEAAQELGLSYYHGGYFSERVIEGTMDGLEVRVETYEEGTGRSRTRYTRILVDGHGTFPPEVELSAEGAFAGLRKAIAGEDILTCDERFDRRVHVAGPAELALAMLSEPARRAVEEVVAAGCTVELGDVCRVTQSVYRNKATLVRLVRLMVDAAGKLGARSIPEGLRANAVGDPLPAVRRRCLRKLVEKFGDSPEAAAALEAALDDPDPTNQFYAACHTPSARARELLECILADEAMPEQVRCDALDRLVALFGYEAVADHVRWALGSGCVALERVAVSAAGAARDAAALDPLLGLAAAADPGLAGAVAAALGEYRGEPVEDALLRLLSHDEAEVRLAAVVALGKAGTVRSVEALLARRGGALEEAARDSVRRIQGRLGDAEAGRLSLADPAGAVGAVSVAQDAEAGANAAPERAKG